MATKDVTDEMIVLACLPMVAAYKSAPRNQSLFNWLGDQVVSIPEAHWPYHIVIAESQQCFKVVAKAIDRASVRRLIDRVGDHPGRYTLLPDGLRLLESVTGRSF